jgi:tripartite-type tricarboxylate transporter receptor subunit TctC
MEGEMTRVGRRNFLKSAAALGAALGTGGVLGMPAVRAHEATWPNRPVRFIVPLAPGGGIDFVARTIGAYVRHQVGQPIVVENRTGAGGTVGMDEAMRSTPDGYTVLITNDSAASTPHTMGLAYDYTKELVPVIFLARQPQVLCVNPSLGVNSVAELIAVAKANPGQVYATSGVGTNQHILGEWFNRETGLELTHVPYRGATLAMNDLIAGHVKIAWLGPTATLPQYRVGNLRLLAQAAAKRAPYLPDIPTLEEAGFKDLVLEMWFGAFVPKGTPAAIVTRLNAVMAEALADPAIKESFNRGSMEAVGGAPEVLGVLAREDSVKYERLVRELDIRAY